MYTAVAAMQRELGCRGDYVTASALSLYALSYTDLYWFNRVVMLDFVKISKLFFSHLNPRILGQRGLVVRNTPIPTSDTHLQHRS